MAKKTITHRRGFQLTAEGVEEIHALEHGREGEWGHLHVEGQVDEGERANILREVGRIGCILQTVVGEKGRDGGRGKGREGGGREGERGGGREGGGREGEGREGERERGGKGTRGEGEKEVL